MSEFADWSMEMPPVLWALVALYFVAVVYAWTVGPWVRRKGVGQVAKRAVSRIWRSLAGWFVAIEQANTGSMIRKGFGVFKYDPMTARCYTARKPLNVILAFFVALNRWATCPSWGWDEAFEQWLWEKWREYVDTERKWKAPSCMGQLVMSCEDLEGEEGDHMVALRVPASLWEQLKPALQPGQVPLSFGYRFNNLVRPEPGLETVQEDDGEVEGWVRWDEWHDR